MTEFVDGNLPKTVSIDDGRYAAQAMFMNVFELAKQQLFVRKTNIPDTALAGRGKAFSLRADYQRSSERFDSYGHLNHQATVIQESMIQIRVSTLKP